MKKTIMLLLAVVLLNGCTQWKKLTGSDTNSDNGYKGADMNGVWVGSVVMAAHAEPFNFIIIQHEGSITNESLMFSHTVDFNGHLTGSVNGNTFTMTGDEGTLCVNKWTFTGTVGNGQLNVRVDGDGNNIAGTSCYPNPVHADFVMGR